MFELFDDTNAWLGAKLPDAMRWINSRLHVRFDDAFRRLLAEAQRRNDFEGLLEYHEYHRVVVNNMDY